MTKRFNRRRKKQTTERPKSMAKKPVTITNATVAGVGGNITGATITGTIETADGGAQPPGIWGGAGEPFPTPPIAIPQPPLGIWGPPDPRPNPPIFLPPPLGIWGPGDPRPTPPIAWPPPPAEPQPEPPEDKWSWHYDEELGWVLVPPGGGGKPQPASSGRRG